MMFLVSFVLRETIHHLFFQCIVAQRIWLSVFQVVGTVCGSDHFLLVIYGLVKL